jgi:hypothetical protein
MEPLTDFPCSGVGSDGFIITGLQKGVYAMARKSGIESESRPGFVVGSEPSGNSADLGSVSENRRADEQSDFAPGEIVERSESSGLATNGRGDGSDYYDSVRKVIKGVRLPWGVSDDVARKRYPQLMASLTDRETPKGKAREGARISLAATKNGFRVTLSDYLISMKLTVDIRYLEDIFKALEHGITSADANWTDMKAGEAYNKRKSDEAKRLGNTDGIS